MLDAQFIGAIPGARLRRRDHGRVPVRGSCCSTSGIRARSPIRAACVEDAAGLVGVALLAMVFAMTKTNAPDPCGLPPNFTAQQIADGRSHHADRGAARP
jgi:hypothetical protein